MKVTIFTSNNIRHNYLIKEISKVAKEVYAIREFRPKYEGEKKTIYKKSKTIKEYFKKVYRAQKFVFKETNNLILPIPKKNIIDIENGKLSKIKIKDHLNFFTSDLYIVFGSSFIKGEVCKFLIANKAINIHMGISPFYRGADCNFWSLYDKNLKYVGSTIHYLSKGLDSGKILYYNYPKYNKNPFIFSMSATKTAILSLKKKINDNSMSKIKPFKQIKKNLIRYSTKREFTSSVIHEFYKKYNIK